MSRQTLLRALNWRALFLLIGTLLVLPSCARCQRTPRADSFPGHSRKRLCSFSRNQRRNELLSTQLTPDGQADAVAILLLQLTRPEALPLQCHGYN